MQASPPPAVAAGWGAWGRWAAGRTESRLNPSKPLARLFSASWLDFHDAIVSPTGRICRDRSRTNCVMVAATAAKSSMPSAKPVLLVDADAVPRHSLAEQLARDGAYTVIEAGSAAEARAAEKYLFAIIDA